MAAKLKKVIQKCPFLALLVSTGILFSLIGLCGRKNVYARQEYNPWKEPALVMMFKALKEDVYPWQIFGSASEPVMASGNGDENDGAVIAGDSEEEDEGKGAEDGEKASGETEAEDGDIQSGENADSGEDGQTAEEADHTSSVQTAPEVKDHSDGDNNTGEAGGEENSQGKPTEEETPPTEEETLWERIEPLRESTREEYLNHISADIYCDAGVKRAAEYEFSQVDESYFDDALFVGDSRTVGLRDYTDLSEHADFYCETSLTIQKMLEENFPGLGTIEEALANKEYGKIYIMLGINELGVGTTEDFMEKYTEAVTYLRETEPEAKIFIQGIMRVTGKKNSTDAIFNNSNINARNNAIATLADNEHIFYIDVNEVVCDEEGNLNSEYTYDQLHLLGVYNDLWKQFLLSHGVKDE